MYDFFGNSFLFEFNNISFKTFFASLVKTKGVFILDEIDGADVEDDDDEVDGKYDDGEDELKEDMIDWLSFLKTASSSLFAVSRIFFKLLFFGVFILHIYCQNCSLSEDAFF